MLKATRTIVETARKNGWAAGRRLAEDRIGRRLWSRTVTELVWLDHADIDPELLDAKGGHARFLTREEVVAATDDPGTGMEPEIVERFDRGDRCFGIFVDGRLAASGWFAFDSIEPEHCFGFGIAMPASVSYMYKGFTHPDFRGQRLHGVVMAMALDAMAQSDGITALVSTVDWTNEASLRSCDRLGYQRLGQVIAWRSNGRQSLSAPTNAAARGLTICDETGQSVKD